MKRSLDARRARKIRKIARARLLRVGLALSSTFFVFRMEASPAKTPFRLGAPQRGWLDAEPLHLPATRVPSRGELFFIDAAVADPRAFWLAAPKGATVVGIPRDVDSWQFMAQEAEKFHGLGAIHIISHGEPGALILNGHRYTAADFDARSAALHQLGRALSKNGDILLYGCDTGQGREGALLVTRLADFTGADVAASSNPTGGLPGSDWVLEVARGPIHTPAIAPVAYNHELATIIVTSNGDSGIGSLRTAISNAVAGDTITFNASMTITLTSGQLSIAKNLTILGDLDSNGTPDVTLDAAYNSRVLSLTAGTVTLDGLIITRGLVAGTGGSAGVDATNAPGGGIFIAGTLTLKDCKVTANAASGGGGGGGVTAPYVGGTVGGGGGGGGGIGGKLGGKGGSAGFGTGVYAGNAGTAGRGGNGGGYTANYMGGRGGSTTGGIGGPGTANYSNGGAGGTANNGTLSIGGGGGGSGWDRTGRAGASAAGGIYTATNGTVTVIGTTTITNNIGAGGGGGGGGGLGGSTSNGGPAGRGIGAVWNKGTFNITAGNFTAMTGNLGGSGAGGPALGGGSTGAAAAAMANIFNDGGTLNTNFFANGAPTFVNSGAGALNLSENASATDVTGLLHVSDTDSSQTETWSQSAAPAHGALTFSGATAASGSANITPGGTITYKPTTGFAGSDSFVVQVSDGTATATRTINVDVAPAVASVAVPANATYVAGQNLDFTVNFASAVTVNATSGTPFIPLTLNTGGTVQAAYISGSGTTALTFRYTVVSGNLDNDGVGLGGGITANGGTLNDSAGNGVALTLNSVPSTAGVLVDAVAPSLISVSSPAGGSYRAGQNLDFTVNYDEAVTVNTGGGTPQIGLTIGSTSVTAAYLSGSGSVTLVFRYIVQPGDTDVDGIASASPILLNGGTIKDAAGNNAALAFTAPNTTGVLVDTTAPLIAISLPSVSMTPSNPVNYTVTYTMANSVTLSSTNITLNKTGAANATSVVVNGSGAATRTVVLSGISGSGTLGITIASGTGSDLAGNTTAAIGPSATFVVNGPPVPGADSLSRLNNTKMAKVAEAVLLSNDTDPENDPLSITAVGNPTPAGAAVTIAGNFVVYTAPSTNAGDGSFTYTLSDGAGGHLVLATVPVVEVTSLTNSAGSNSALIVPSGSDFILTFIGVPDNGYRVQYTTNASTPFTWNEFSPPALFTAPSNGVFSYTDTNPPGPSRFYRAVPNP